MANQLMKMPEGKERIVPPSDPAERIKFWIERGNRLLTEAGRTDLEWVWRNGSYSIEEKVHVRRQIAWEGSNK